MKTQKLNKKYIISGFININSNKNTTFVDEKPIFFRPFLMQN